VRLGNSKAEGLLVRVFVSYARENKAAVRSLGADLGALGHDAWFDDKLLGGQDWWEEILQRIREADVLVFVLSPTSVRSNACLAELSYADRCRRRLLPVMVASTPLDELPAELGHAQYVHYQPDGNFRDLAAALTNMPAPPPLPEPPPAPPPLPEEEVTVIRRAVRSKTDLTRGEQHELLDRIIGLSRQPGELRGAYDVLLLFRDRPDLLADVRDRVDATARKLWGELQEGAASTGSGSPGETPLGPQPDGRPAWSALEFAVLVLTGALCGIPPLVIGGVNLKYPARRKQAYLLLGVGVLALVAWTVLLPIIAPSDSQS
jgi:hypothetical protein